MLIHQLTLCPFSSIGFFGALRVLFNVQAADPATLALADGTPLFSYFDPPTADLTLTAEALLLEPLVATLAECGRACLSDRTCLAFSQLSNSTCELYQAIQTEQNSVPTPVAQYYQKIGDRVSLCRAKSGSALYYSTF